MEFEARVGPDQTNNGHFKYRTKAPLWATAVMDCSIYQTITDEESHDLLPTAAQLQLMALVQVEDASTFSDALPHPEPLSPAQALFQVVVFDRWCWQNQW